MEANVIQTKTIQIVSKEVIDGILWATVSNPENDYDGFEKLPNLIQLDGKIIGKSCFNSDSATACYSQNHVKQYATVIDNFQDVDFDYLKNKTRIG